MTTFHSDAKYSSIQYATEMATFLLLSFLFYENSLPSFLSLQKTLSTWRGEVNIAGNPADVRTNHFPGCMCTLKIAPQSTPRLPPPRKTGGGSNQTTKIVVLFCRKITCDFLRSFVFRFLLIFFLIRNKKYCPDTGLV